MDASYKDIDSYVAVFKALSNPHRLRILMATVEELRGEDEIVCSRQESTCQRDHAELYEIAPSTMSHHLKELTHAGLLRVRRDGQRTVWEVNKEGIHAVRKLLEWLDS
jgi:ArsR family transcriptional regulator